MEDSEKIFTELIESIERRRSEVKELIRAQEKTELSQAEELLKKLEQEIADLRRRDAELEQLSHSEDHIHFLQVTSLTLSSSTEGVSFTKFFPLEVQISPVVKSLICVSLSLCRVSSLSLLLLNLQTYPVSQSVHSSPWRN